jgi:hypothetical protein
MESQTTPITPENQLILNDLYQKIPLLMKELYPNVSDVDYYTNTEAIKRFAIAQEFKPDQVIEKWKNWVQWRTTYKPEKIREDEEAIEKQMETGKLRWYKHDKERRPCLYYKMRYHRPGLATTDEAVRYFIFMLEKGIKEAEKLGSTKIVVLYDRKGYSKKNHDPQTVDTMKKLMPILQDYYPERLEMFYVNGANWFYRMMFDIVKAFLSKKTIEKVKVLAGVEDLLQYFDKENLSIEYGGIPESSKFGQQVKHAGSVGIHGGDDVIKSESEDETELKKLANTIYTNYGVTKPTGFSEDFH